MLTYDVIATHYKDNYLRLTKQYSRRAGANDVDDLIQETYTRALRYKDSFKQGSDLDSWVGRIANNCMKALYNEKQGRGNMHEFNEEIYQTNNEELKEDANLAERIKQDVEELSPSTQKDIIYLSVCRDYNNKAISQVLDVTENHVNAELSVFRKKMREKYGCLRGD